jgi:hypothetical protein
VAQQAASRGGSPTAAAAGVEDRRQRGDGAVSFGVTMGPTEHRRTQCLQRIDSKQIRSQMEGAAQCQCQLVT